MGLNKKNTKLKAKKILEYNNVPLRPCFSKDLFSFCKDIEGSCKILEDPLENPGGPYKYFLRPYEGLPGPCKHVCKMSARILKIHGKYACILHKNPAWIACGFFSPDL